MKESLIMILKDRNMQDHFNKSVLSDFKQLNEEVNERIPDDDLERSKHVGSLLIKVF